MSENILDSNAINKLSIEADELLIAHDQIGLETFLDSHVSANYTFISLIDEAQFYYTLGNCSQELYKCHEQGWFSDKLNQSVIFFRKALYAIRQIKFPAGTELYLQSCIETNLGNNLCSQGRVLCCIPLWDNALLKRNRVAIIRKAYNELFLADYIYNQDHKHYHYFTAYNLINLGLNHLDELYPEQKVAYSKDGNLMSFKARFEDIYKPEEFDYFDKFVEDIETRKQGDYLEWCGNNNLFLNDLNDVSISKIVYEDIITLPNFKFRINPALSMYEELMYHGNFDELKNDYCYARYLIFSAQNIPNDHQHFFNNTYPHIDDMSYTITNLKAHHYKSAFRVLYALFDKIAYFINRFFDLNDTDLDHKISFDSIFKELKRSKSWIPHNKLKDSQNYFIHALFHILKDIRDVKDLTSVSRWLDPDAKAFADIRNAIEHRSLKIIDDFGYTLTQSDKDLRQSQLEQLHRDRENFEAKLQAFTGEIDLTKNTNNNVLKVELETKKRELEENLHDVKSQIREKQKLSSHSVLIKESEFESRLMTLIKLVRNSIIYLSLAIHFEEKNKPVNDRLMMSREVPLK